VGSPSHRTQINKCCTPFLLNPTTDAKGSLLFIPPAAKEAEGARALLPLLGEDVLMLSSSKSAGVRGRRQFGHDQEAAQVAQTTISFACEAACKLSPRHEQEKSNVAGWLHTKHGFWTMSTKLSLPLLI